MLCFGRTLTHPLGLKSKPSKKQHKAGGKPACLFAACFLLRLLFNPEGGGDAFL
jgi:hypothetical protein